MVSPIASQQESFQFRTPGASLYGVYMLSLCQCGFSLGTLASCHSPKAQLTGDSPLTVEAW